MWWQGWTARIMTCVWNGNLHGWEVYRSKKHSQKQLLHTDHWMHIPKSRECNKHTWFVIRLGIRPVAASLNRLKNLLWRTVATSHSTTGTCAQLNSQLQNNSTFSPLQLHAQKVLAHKWKDMHHFLCPTVWIHQAPFGSLHTHILDTSINPTVYEPSITQWFNSPYIYHHIYIMNATHCWPFASEYLIWNATVTALWFWTADLKPHILSDAIEWVYMAFFYGNSAQQLQNLSEEILFDHFVTTLNDTFKKELVHEDEGYESRKESLSIPTPLRRAPWIHYISTGENLSFNPTTPLTTAEQHPEHSPQRFRSHSPIYPCLMFTSSDNENPVRTSDPCL